MRSPGKGGRGSATAGKRDIGARFGYAKSNRGVLLASDLRKRTGTTLKANAAAWRGVYKDGRPSSLKSEHGGENPGKVEGGPKAGDEVGNSRGVFYQNAP